jgi:hypothetical protein
LSKIEQAVEDLRPDLLDTLTQDLLTKEQETFSKKRLQVQWLLPCCDKDAGGI